jgi:DNA-binding MarR family transcriptional regulator
MNLDPQQLPLGLLLNTVGRTILEATEAALEGDELGVVELGILWLVSLDSGLPQAEYARFQKRDLTTFGRYVDRLEARAFLLRTPHPNDRRVKTLTVTKAGMKAMEQARRKALKAETAIVASAPDIARELKELLVKLMNQMT